MSEEAVTRKETQDAEMEEGPASIRLEQQQVAGMWIPERFEVWADGIYKRKSFTVSAEEGAPPTPSIIEPAPFQHALKRLERITGRPAYVSGIGHRVDDDAELVGLTYLQGADTDDPSWTDEERARASLAGHNRGPNWNTLWVKHSQIANANELLKLADDVFPVRTSNSKQMSDFLTDCYDANQGLSMKKTIVRRIGHHYVDGQHGWLVGQRWIGPPSVMADPNPNKLSKALHTRGSEQEWLDFTQAQWSKPNDKAWVIRWMLAASFTSPLLRHIGERTFFLHHYFQSGAGKSLLSYLGQSAWGHPREFARSMNRATQNSLTEIFKYISDLPLLCDEMQGRQSDASDFIMQAASEEHKTRVKQEGGLMADDAKTWRLLIRTTGEQTLAGADKADTGGQANRVMEVRHPGLEVDQAKEIWGWLEHPKHYGWAGIRFLTKLAEVVNDEDRLLALKSKFQDYAKAMCDFTGQSRALERQLAAVALGEFLMLRWVYGFDAIEAKELAFRDTWDVARNWLRIRDGDNLLWSQAVDFLVGHRSEYAQQYADVTTDAGLAKLRLHGSKSSLPLVAAVNAGQDGNEIWYFRDAIDKLLRAHHGIPGSRIFEDLAQEGILDRSPDRLSRHRQIRGVFEAKVYVIRADKLFAHQAEPVKIDMTELSDYIPEMDEWDSSEREDEA